MNSIKKLRKLTKHLDIATFTLTELVRGQEMENEIKHNRYGIISNVLFLLKIVQYFILYS